DSRLLQQAANVRGVLRAGDSLSIERLNEIRRRILQSVDSLGGGMPVKHPVSP
ncbi:MAG: hypothetical protein GY869_29995, partial [Planctomycetes bacterium]|nr:hypothetical protein [Planctomycetota bacterium]